MNKQFNVALIGNPNTGKSTLFNALTGLNQKIGNFSGVTVERKTGKLEFNENLTASLIDLPGTYSLYPRSADEHIALEILNSTKNPDYPNMNEQRTEYKTIFKGNLSDENNNFSYPLFIAMLNSVEGFFNHIY